MAAPRLLADALRPGHASCHARAFDAAELAARPDRRVTAIALERTAADLAALPGYAAVADRILFDARAPKDATRPGGLGVPFDWHLLENVKLPIPFMVGGGLNVGNVAEAIRVTRANGVDVSSGVESAPGVKDPGMIRAFIRAVRDAESAATSSKIASSV